MRKFTDYPVEIVPHDDGYFCAFLPDFGFSACGATSDDQDAALYVLETVFEGVAAHYASVGRELPTPSTFEQVTEWPRPRDAREQRDVDGKLLLSHFDAVNVLKAKVAKLDTSAAAMRSLLGSLARGCSCGAVGTPVCDHCRIVQLLEVDDAGARVLAIIKAVEEYIEINQTAADSEEQFLAMCEAFDDWRAGEPKEVV